MNSKMTINDIIEKYYLSSDFNMLAEKSKRDYQYFLNIMLGTKINNKEIWAQRLSYVGELGFELYIKMDEFI